MSFDPKKEPENHESIADRRLQISSTGKRLFALLLKFFGLASLLWKYCFSINL